MRYETLRRFFGLNFKTAKQPYRRERVQLRVELLEDRAVPSVSTTFVNDNWAFISDTDNSGTLSLGDEIRNNNDTINTGGITAFYGLNGFGTVFGAPGGATSLPGDATISDAINFTNTGGTVNVLEGTYDVSAGVTINNGLTLLGAKHGVAGTDGSRGTAESILNGPVSNTAGVFTFNTTAPVTVDGFTISTTKIGSGQPANSDLRFLNNVFNLQANSAVGGTGLILSDPTQFTLTNNFFTTTGSNPSNSAVIQVEGNYAGGADTTNLMNVTGNKFVGIANSIDHQSTLQLNFDNVQGNVHNNTFDGVDIGVILAGNTGNMTIDSNTFKNITRGTAEIDAGFFGAGVVFYNPTLNGPVTISNNTFQNSDAGIRTSTDGTGGPYTLNSPQVAITGNTFTGNLHDIVDKFAGTLTPGGTNVFDGVALSAASTTQLFAIEDKIVDRIDVSGYGLVRLKAGNVYVTPNSFFIPGGTTTPSIQRAVDAASAGDTVNVAAGTYDISAGVTINKNLTLLGAKAGVAGTDASRGTGESILTGPTDEVHDAFAFGTTDPVTLNGFTINTKRIAQGTVVAGSDLRFLDNVLNLEARTVGAQINMILSNPKELTLTDNKFVTTGSNPSNSAVIQVAGNYAGGADTTNFMNVTGNTFVGIANPTDLQSTLQLNFSGVQGNVQNNTFDGVDIGVLVANSSGNLTIDQNVFKNITRGAAEIATGSFAAGVVFFNPTLNGPVTISNNTFQNSDAGFRTSTDGTGGPYTLNSPQVTITGNTFTSNLHDIVDKFAGTLTLGGTNVFGGVTLSAASTTQLFAIEDKIVDAIDVSGYGLVRLKAGNVYVTPNSFFAPGGTTTPSIQRGVDAASVGDNVNVAAGTYAENVNVNKTVHLLGAQQGVDARTRSGAETIVDGATNGGKTPFYITASDVTLDGFTVQGATNVNLFGFGIFINPGVSGTHVINDIIQNNIAGIALTNASAADQALVQHNLFQNNTQNPPGAAASGNDIYADQFTAGVGGINNALIDANTFTNTAATESAWALDISNTDATLFTNITFSNNTVTNHGRGVFFSNTDGAAVTSNTITGASHYAIGAFSNGSGTVTITNNSVTGGNVALDVEDYANLSITNMSSSGNTSGGKIVNVPTVNLTGAAGSSISADMSAQTFGTNVMQSVSFAGSAPTTLHLLTLGNGSLFRVKPVTTGTTTITVDGGTPFPPGSNLLIDTTAVTSPVINNTGPGAGNLTATPAANPLSWTNANASTRIPTVWSPAAVAAGFSTQVTGDFNNDGKSDIATYYPTTGQWMVALSNGTGFQTPVAWSTFVAGPGWTTQIVGDFNGDHKADIANYFGASGRWWVNLSTGSSFTTMLFSTFGGTTGWTTQIVGDFNGDGKDDMANYNTNSGKWWVGISNGSSFANTTWSTFGATTGWTSQIVGDFNHDGKDDIANFYSASAKWWINISTGASFTPTVFTTLSPATGWGTQISGDFNGDGRSDIANFHTSDATWWVSISNGSSFTTTQWTTLSPTTGWTSQIVGDFNNDGKADIANFQSSNASWLVDLSNGSSFTNTFWTAQFPATGWNTHLVADFNGDHASDLADFNDTTRLWWVTD